jgi:hypothetical protein
MRSRTITSPWRRAALVAVIAAAVLGPGAACNTVPLLAPTQSAITLAISPLVLPINGIAEIIATVIEQSGTAVQNGTLVTFTTTLGTVSPREARTENGQVLVRLNAGNRSGLATVGALSGDAISESVDVQIGGAAASTIVVTANPSVVPSVGGTVQIVAFVTDENGNRVAGVPVTFTTTAGRLANTIVPTNQAGEARVRLTTSQDATVTATLGNVFTDIFVTVNTAPTVALTVPSPVTEGEGATFTLSVTAGATPIRTVTIDFGDGSAQSLGALTGTGTVAHVYRRDGTYVVTVTATDAGGESTTVTSTVVVDEEEVTPLNVTLSVTTTGTLTAPISVAFSAAVTPTTATIVRYNWTFGDGTSARTSGASTSHVYTKSDTGANTVTVTAIDTDGRRASAQIEILIE